MSYLIHLDGPLTGSLRAVTLPGDSRGDGRGGRGISSALTEDSRKLEDGLWNSNVSPKPSSTLWLSAVNRPARFGRGRKAGTRATPPKTGGSCDLG